MLTAVFRAPTIDDTKPGDTVTSLAIGYSQPIAIDSVEEHEDDPRYVIVTYISALGRTHVRTIARDTRVTPWDGPEPDLYSEAEYARERADCDD